MKIAVCFIALLAFVHSKPQFQQFQQQQQQPQQLGLYSGQTGPSEPYEFNYKVENSPTNTFFGQNENGDASGNKVGSYYVLLPDGRTMTVNYVADGNGFIPKISFQGGQAGTGRLG